MLSDLSTTWTYCETAFSGLRRHHNANIFYISNTKYPISQITRILSYSITKQVSPSVVHLHRFTGGLKYIAGLAV